MRPNTFARIQAWVSDQWTDVLVAQVPYMPGDTLWPRACRSARHYGVRHRVLTDNGVVYRDTADYPVCQPADPVPAATPETE